MAQHYIALYKKDWHARERNTAQHGLRIEWLEQQLKDKEDLIASMNGRLHSAETQEVSRESALENARATAAPPIMYSNTTFQPMRKAQISPQET